LNGACAHKAGVCAGKSARRPRSLGRRPAWLGCRRETIESTRKEDMKSITRPGRQIHNEAEVHTWRL
jgi:hypothetical protein